MSIGLHHAIVPSRDRRAAAERIATIPGVSWSQTGGAPFCPVHVNAGLTLDDNQTAGDAPVREALAVSCARPSAS